MNQAVDAGRNPRAQEHDCSLPASVGWLNPVSSPALSQP